MSDPPPGIQLEQADWLIGAASLPASSIDLLYADPPFNTGRRQMTPPNAGKADRQTGAQYEDCWETMGDYVAWLRARLAATLPAMRRSGCVLIHVDFRACHHVRLLLDELLGADRFVNHLIWRYGLGGSSPRRFARKHDDILFYCIQPEAYYFDPPMVPATSQRLRGQLKKSTDIIEVGLPQDEVLNIPSLNNQAKERTGYPTQKPVALLELLIRACSPAGGTVLDPCCGSGTTLVAAAGAGRRAVGFDISDGAVATARARLASMRPDQMVRA